MKKKQEFIVRTIAGETIMMPMGEAALKFSGLIKPNDTAAFIWEHLEDAENEEVLTKMLCEEFEVDYNEAYEDVCNIVKNMRTAGWIE